MRLWSFSSLLLLHEGLSQTLSLFLFSLFVKLQHTLCVHVYTPTLGWAIFLMFGRRGATNSRPVLSINLYNATASIVKCCYSVWLPKQRFKYTRVVGCVSDPQGKFTFTVLSGFFFFFFYQELTPLHSRQLHKSFSADAERCWCWLFLLHIGLPHVWSDHVCSPCYLMHIQISHSKSRDLAVSPMVVRLNTSPLPTRFLSQNPDSLATLENQMCIGSPLKKFRREN